MESNAFGNSHLPSQALVVLSEAASGLHEALRGQRPFPSRLPDAKDLHNMSLVGNYNLLHSFHPHLLQTLNHGMLAANGAGGPASYFANERSTLGKPSMLSNFSIPSAFSPPKYIGISLDQNLFNGNDSFRTDSASPTCTSHESMEGSQDYDAEKGESPRSNNSQDPRDLRHMHSKTANACSSASSTSSNSSSSANAIAPSSTPTLIPSTASISVSTPTIASHLAAHHAHAHAHHHHQHSHLPQHALPPPPPPHVHHHHHLHPNGSLLAATMGGLTMGLRAVSGGLSLASLSNAANVLSSGGPVPDICPVCGIKLTPEEWNSHFLTELDRLYKLSAGMERPNLQATYMFAPPCPAQENAIRTSHNRWETFQRIRNNRQNRLRIKVRKRKYGDMFMMENIFCNSCPICKRKFALETGKLPTEEDIKMQEEIETVDVESCNDDVPDSGSELQQPQLTLNSGNSSSSHHISNMHNSNNQPGKLDGILYRTACVINKEMTPTTATTSGSGCGGEDDISTNVASTSSGSGSSWTEVGHHNAVASGTVPNTTTNTQGHISVKNVSELSSTTHHFYNADSCGEERTTQNGIAGVNKDIMMDTCNNDSDEDVIVDDDDNCSALKMTTNSNNSNGSSYCHAKLQKRKYEDTVGSSSRAIENISPVEERPRSEPQVTSSEQSMELPNHNNNNNTIDAHNNNNNSNAHVQLGSVPGLTQLDTKVGISSDIKTDEEQKCFICKTGIKDLSPDSFFRGRNLYFHQSCANVMSSYRLNKELLQQQQQQNATQMSQQGSQVGSISPVDSPQQSSATTNID